MLVDQVNQVVKEVAMLNMTVTEKDVKRCTDLAYLEETVNPQELKKICADAASGEACAAVCVFPEAIELAREYLAGTEVKVASVLNFPLGDQDSRAVRKAIDSSIANGAQELDLVFPYQRYIEAKAEAYKHFEKIYEHIAKRAYTKVIIESGAFLDDINVIYDLCCGLIDLDVDMIKTSTGRYENGPNARSAAAILFAVKNHSIGATTGVKISGGIRSCDDAVIYARLYQQIISKDWRNRGRLRFGSSQLIS